jgi:hypothetical protein
MSHDPGVDASGVAAVAQRYGVARLEVFGSVARGEETAGSEVDLVLKVLPGARLGRSVRREASVAARADPRW